jgi:hypothetical protein
VGVPFASPEQSTDGESLSLSDQCGSAIAATVAAPSRLAVSICVVGDVRREVKAPRPTAS